MGFLETKHKSANCGCFCLNALKIGVFKMISIKFKTPPDCTVSSACECDDCGAELELWEVTPIVNPQHKMHMGDVVPAGQCPQCASGYVYLLEALE